jgi:RNA polymerase sigma-70 factor, ECF subfamily
LSEIRNQKSGIKYAERSLWRKSNQRMTNQILPTAHCPLPTADCTPDDMDVIRSVQAGNSELFALLVNKYHRHLLNFIYRLVGNEQIVEDIGQEVFLSIYKSIRAFDVSRGIPFSAWLFITARNRCISELRRKIPKTLSIEATVTLPAKGKTPELVAIEKERLLTIQTALELLPEPYKTTILQSLRGDSPEEIAQSNRISRGTVKSRLARAREKLRILLKEHLGGNLDGQF